MRQVVNTCWVGTLQGKVEAKGEKEKQLFHKNMCYCKNVGGDLAKSMADAKKRGHAAQRQELPGHYPCKLVGGGVG